MLRARRLEILIFLATFFAFAYFNQGGGWNQNSRFAEVRAIAEEGRFAIDSFLVYKRTNTPKFARFPVRNGDLVLRGKTLRLCWGNENDELIPINGVPISDDVKGVPFEQYTCSGDVAFARGHFHPNKPPGTTFVAVPAYFLLQKIERVFGFSQDDWRVLDANAWLTSVFSVGLIAALGCILFFRIAKSLAGGNDGIAFAATLAFAFGTLFFPFATLLFDHDLTAIFLFASFYWIFTADKSSHRSRSLYLSGLAAGMAAITNYIAAAAVIFLTMYLFTKLRGGKSTVRDLTAFAIGICGPFLLICAYNQICYGSPFAICNSFQNPLFVDPTPKVLGMFGVPRPDYAAALLFSPFRGIFCFAPVLLLGVYGWSKMRAKWPAEAWLIAAMCGLFFLVNASFVGWHAGFSSGPRYLIPAIPFLALPMVFGFAKFPRASALLMLLSVAINLVLVAVDAESPVGVGDLAIIDGRPMWLYSPVADYALPIFFSGRAWPLLKDFLKQDLDRESQQMSAAGIGADERARRLAQRRSELFASIDRGGANPFLLASFTGPVSVNPIEVCASGYYMLGTMTKAARWASFNVGEFLFPHSRWSLAPLLLIEATLLALASHAIRTAPRL